MIVVRMMLAAMAAVGLSVGGYELGSKQGTVPVITPTVNVPEDHPLSVALKTTDAQSMTPASRDKLVRLALSLKSDEEHARSDAQMEAAKVVFRLQSTASQKDLSVKESNEKIKRLEAQLAERSKQYDSKSKEVRELKLKITLARQDKEKVQRLYFTTAQDQAVQVYGGSRFIDLRRDVEKQLTEEKIKNLYLDYSTKTLQEIPAKTSEKVKEEAASRRDMNEEKGFALLIALRNRDELKLTPQQVTQLQYLQADFIRRFAPIREAYETRVTNLKWNYADSRVFVNQDKSIDLGELRKEDGVKREYYVETSGKTKTQVRYWLFPNATKSGSSDTINLRFSTSKPGNTKTNIRYFVWTSDESLESQLKSLKKEMDAKANKLLSTPQRQVLQEKVDQSLAASK